MRNLILLVGLVGVVVGCDATRPVTLGPDCEWSRPVGEYATLRVYYSDCTAMNTDSLRADGWTVTWGRH